MQFCAYEPNHQNCREVNKLYRRISEFSYRRRVDREFPEWGLPLIEALNGMRVPGHEDHYITVLHATEHRCGVKLSGPNLSDEITGTDPLKDNLPLKKVVAKNKDNSDAVFTANLVPLNFFQVS